MVDSTIGIGDPGNSQVLRFDEDASTKHIKKWMEGPKDNNSLREYKVLKMPLMMDFCGQASLFLAQYPSNITRMLDGFGAGFMIRSRLLLL